VKPGKAIGSALIHQKNFRKLKYYDIIFDINRIKPPDSLSAAVFDSVAAIPIAGCDSASIINDILPP